MRPEHVARFAQEGFKAQNANKSVVSGIELVAKGYKENSLLVVRERVKKFFDEIYQYVWNSKTGKPVEEHDDVMDAIRYAIYTKETIQDWLY